MKSTAPLSAETKPTGKTRRLLKGLGVAGFLFFLIKGIVWLAVFYGMADLFSK
jgi:hypothetical protein